MANLQLVIFDCDGVLVDSEPIVNRTFAETLTEAGFHITYEEVSQRFIGKSSAVCIQEIEQTFGRALPPQCLELCKERTNAILTRELQATVGIANVLEQLSLPRCVASNSSPRHIDLVLKLTGLIGYFNGQLFSSHHVDRPKPFPDLYLYAAQQMGIKPENCVVIEDSIPGVQAGHAAGMRVFGYAQGDRYNTEYRESLMAAGAQLVFGAMHELPSLLALLESANAQKTG